MNTSKYVHDSGMQPIQRKGRATDVYCPFCDNRVSLEKFEGIETVKEGNHSTRYAMTCPECGAELDFRVSEVKKLNETLVQVWHHRVLREQAHEASSVEE